MNVRIFGSRYQRQIDCTPGYERISHTERETRFTEVSNAYRVLPDLVTILSDAALLTPATVNRILLESGRCGDFLNDPELFLEKVSEIIRDNRHALAIDGIRYLSMIIRHPLPVSF